MASDNSEKQLVSIQFRCQRITTEYCYINVPVTGDMMLMQPDGTARLHVDRLVSRAGEISQSSGVRWYVEAQETHPHPIQKPMDPGEERFQGAFPAE